MQEEEEEKEEKLPMLSAVTAPKLADSPQNGTSDFKADALTKNPFFPPAAHLLIERRR
jgi:hypothetical protein